MRGPGWSEPMPRQMPRAFAIEALEGDEWKVVMAAGDHYGRHVVHSLGRAVSGVRFVLQETWGEPESRVYAFTLNDPGLKNPEGNP